MNMNYRKLAAMALLGLYTHSHAAEAPLRTTRVQFADLEMHDAEDVRHLYARIRFAAHKVCEDRGVVQLLLVAKYEACRRAAIDEAVAAVGSPLLTALHVRQGGRSTRRVANLN